MAISSWRITCNFRANKGETFVEGRIHFEHAASKEEAEAKTTAYLESQHYTDIEITESHEETWDEKYRKLPVHPALAAERAPKPVPKPEPAPQPKAAPEDDGASDELF